MSWPGWLTYSGRFTDINGHPSATSQAQDKESSPAKDQRSTAVPCNQLLPNWRGQGNKCANEWQKNSENPLHSNLCHLLSFITHSNVRSHLAHLWVADGNIFPREVVELGVFGVTVSQPHGVIGVEP